MRPVLLLVLGLLALTPGAAWAQAVNAPPGLSGVDEYLETVPGAGGAERPGGGVAKPLDDPAVAPKARAAVPAATLDALSEAGEDGEAAAALAASGTPDSAPGGAGPPRVALPDVPEPNGAGRIATVVSGGSGAGWFLPAGLAALTLLLLAAALRRRATA